MPCAGASEETGTAGRPPTPLQEPLESWGWGRGAGQRCPHLPPWPWLVAAGGKNGRLGRMARWEGDGQSGKSEPWGPVPSHAQEVCPARSGQRRGIQAVAQHCGGCGQKGVGPGGSWEQPPELRL